MSFGYFKNLCQLKLYHSTNLHLKPHISPIHIMIFNIYNTQRPLLSFVINSVSFKFISSSITIFLLSTKAFPSSWNIDSNNVNNPYFSWQRHFVKNSLHRMINDICTPNPCPQFVFPFKDFLNLSRLSLCSFQFNDQQVFIFRNIFTFHIQYWVVGLWSG